MTFIELADGRSIAEVAHCETEAEHWIVCRVEAAGSRFRVAGDPAGVPVLGSSLALLLDAALDSDGDIGHLETGRLADL